MINLEADSADSVWRQALSEILSTGHVQPGRDQPTQELVHVGLNISDPRQRLVFARPISPAFAIAEVIWILSGWNDLEFLAFWNPRMRRFSDDGVCLSGAYGKRLGSHPNLPVELQEQMNHDESSTSHVDQLKVAYEALRHDPTSRQVVMQIWDRTLDLPDPSPRSKDVPCNLVSHLLVRDGRLYWLQVMRSNDLIWGMPYNIFQFTTLQETMASWLGVEVGDYSHISSSLHIYERHWEVVETIDLAPEPIPRNQTRMTIGTYDEWEEEWSNLVEIVLNIMSSSNVTALEASLASGASLGSAYSEWVTVLAAEALWKLNSQSEAHRMIEASGPYWTESWKRWIESRRPSNSPSDTGTG